ncbi:hypothetical protein AVEN_120435-1 [Araneus ventricosus]|uniref:Uncharacterized protein n=1 Tax=Araneus ventricosus TaxID=182803 RepID=A0A4Y2UGL7_ARAVE|nr:hypothetical protein AVEN_120435-1 [Araneus ventricosus]
MQVMCGEGNEEYLRMRRILPIPSKQDALNVCFLQNPPELVGKRQVSSVPSLHRQFLPLRMRMELTSIVLYRTDRDSQPFDGFGPKFYTDLHYDDKTVYQILSI